MGTCRVRVGAARGLKGAAEWLRAKDRARFHTPVRRLGSPGASRAVMGASPWAVGAKATMGAPLKATAPYEQGLATVFYARAG